MTTFARLMTVLILIMVQSLAAQAVEPDEILDDPALEARAREISRNLRCLVCQNENIDSSHATLAKDLRILVRERLVAGDSDKEVVLFLVDRYGDFVLLKPPVQGNTLLLWLAPVLFMALGGGSLYFYNRGVRQAPERADTAEAGLSEDERSQVSDLLDDR
jgi:cytochrome c-type biogenesis protein CcmH